MRSARSRAAGRRPSVRPPAVDRCRGSGHGAVVPFLVGPRREGGLELCEHPVDGHDRTLRGDDPQDAGARRLDLDRRLVGLDLDDELTRGDRLAVLHEPAAHLRLLHREGELRHEDGGHATRRSTATTTSSADGYTASMPLGVQGIGTSVQATRSTGASR